jgi:hypothetical protein
MELEDSLHYSQERAADPYPEPTKSTRALK